MGDREKKSPARTLSPEKAHTSLSKRSLGVQGQPEPELLAHTKTTVNLYGFIDLLSGFYQDIQSSKQELPEETIELISRTLQFARLRLQGANEDDSIQSHVVALTNLSKVIGSAHPVALFGIATFAIFEVCCGPFGKWQRHLHGARSLLDLHCQTKAELDSLTQRIPGIADVLGYLVWFDVTGTLNRGDQALIFDDWHREILSPEFFNSVGCPPDSFDLFVHLAKGGTDLEPIDLSSRAMAQILHLSTNDSTDRGLACIVFRGSAAIEAFARVGENSLSPTPSTYANVISLMVDKVCDAIASIPTSSRFYVHLATPAYLTGMYATRSPQCEVVRAYWQNCQMCDFPRYPDGQELCEQKWRSEGII
ncbi:hypothetical protein N7462_001947 [Penicillium macrosclerotiorum]|uniref:uncharacterized protein n=1 Tax=Penicillium macrosclerotiorum TaxID=303699 RepID=UPI0025483B5F|nr:uncharacterized protein N7462_001947 [Penicillium macrosclerotiorum]KAJ5692524.1 hypothetical protein N7462_001947 [Penicillium macrosclerotiorum]